MPRRPASETSQAHALSKALRGTFTPAEGMTDKMRELLERLEESELGPQDAIKVLQDAEAADKPTQPSPK